MHDTQAAPPEAFLEESQDAPQKAFHEAFDTVIFQLSGLTFEHSKPCIAAGARRHMLLLQFDFVGCDSFEGDSTEAQLRKLGGSARRPSAKAQLGGLARGGLRIWPTKDFVHACCGAQDYVRFTG